MENLTKGLDEQAPQCMLFGVNQKGETVANLEHQLGQLQQVLEPNGLRTGREKSSPQWPVSKADGRISIFGVSIPE